MPKLPRCREYGPQLPNVGSEVQTPASLQIDVHYGTLFIRHPWTWDRYIRLASFLRLTPAELASFVRMPHKDLPVFEQTLRLHVQRAAPLELLLTQLEAHVYRGLTDEIQPNPFPDLTAFVDALQKHT